MRYKKFQKSIQIFIFLLGSEIENIKVEDVSVGERLLIKAVDCLKALVDRLEDSLLTVGQFKLIQQNTRQFIRLASILKVRGNPRNTSSFLTELIDEQDRSLSKFFRRKDELSVFVQLCKKPSSIKGIMIAFFTHLLPFLYSLFSG